MWKNECAMGNALSRDNQIKEQIQSFKEEVAHTAPVSPKDNADQTSIRSQEGAEPALNNASEAWQQTQFNPHGITDSTFDSSKAVAFGLPEATKQVASNPQGAIHETSSYPQNSTQQLSFPGLGLVESISYGPSDQIEICSNQQEVPVIIPPSGCAPAKHAGWTPRSYENTASFQKALNQSPESEFDFTNFVNFVAV